MRGTNARSRRHPPELEPSARAEEGRRHEPQPREGIHDSHVGKRLPERRPAGFSGQRAAGSMKTLSVRAQNVLKELAVELMDEQPPKGPWSPSRELLLTLTVERLASARNCGPQTAREILDWAQGCGVTIKPSLPAGRSLSRMWEGLIANAATGALTSTEVIGALEKSIRRKSVRIPVAFQIILLSILTSTFD